MERGSDKVSRRQDEALKHDTEGLVRSGHGTHAEEWKGSEPSGEDQPDVDRAPDSTMVGGTPAGMTGEDIDGRSELASFVGPAAYPVVGQQLLELVQENNAPDRIIDLVRRLPSGQQFGSLNDVWTALGGHVETGRF